MNTNSLVSKTLDRLMEIVFATKPGLLIPPQDQLSKQLSVSRTVIREAISKLEYLNVISVRPKLGSKVNPPAEWRVINGDVLQWRKRAAMATPTPRFANVSCSQCGNDFGPGDSGFSHCADHAKATGA